MKLCHGSESVGRLKAENMWGFFEIEDQGLGFSSATY